MSIEGDKYSYSAVLYHFEKASKETTEFIRNVGTEKFYAFPNDVKENFYNLHLSVINECYGGNFNPYIFFKGQDGKLNIENTRYHDTDKGEPLNPFSNQGKAAIIQALEKGIKYDAPSCIIKNTMIETISKTFPDLKDSILQAIENAETQKKQAKLEEELLKQAAVKLNADKAHLKSHVHVVR